MPLRAGGRPLRAGLWYDFRNPPAWRQPFDRLYAETLEHIAHAERIGFDDIWTSEHHFTEDGYSPSLLPICAAIAARTARVRIGTNVLLLPFHDPVRVAEDAAAVDILSGGRFDLGVAGGYRLEEFEGLGVDRRSRARRMDEAVEVIRRAWAPGPFSFDGKHYRYSNIEVTPKPIQDPMPLWMGGFSSPAIRRAARAADGLLSAGGGDILAVYADERAKRGRELEPPRVAIAAPWAVVAADPDAAWAKIGQHVLYQRQLYARWFSAAGMGLFPSIPTTTAEVRSLTPDVVVTPQRAAEIIRAAVSLFPITHIYWWAIPPGIRPADCVDSIDLFVRKVIPLLS